MKKYQIILKDNLIREITSDDLEILRLQKNQNKEFFFHKNDISKEDQLRWYGGYLKREEDWMMVCYADYGDIWGIMGVRKLEEDILDFYNIIRVKKLKNTSMKDTFLEFIYFMKKIYPTHRIQVEVLMNNPAIGWYENVGFKKTKYLEQSVIMNF
jgi:ribosomal protein S18 acetylase RimI-like enzyme